MGEHIYEGLGADNRLLRVNAMHVSGVHRGQMGSLYEDEAWQVRDGHPAGLLAVGEAAGAPGGALGGAPCREAES
jgi:hypothetical protein